MTGNNITIKETKKVRLNVKDRNKQSSMTKVIWMNFFCTPWKETEKNIIPITIQRDTKPKTKILTSIEIAQSISEWKKQLKKR